KTTVDQMHLLAEEKNLTLSFESHQAVEVDGDPLRLKQIVVNLVDNAIKYTAPGGSVCVSAVPKDEMVVLEVADTGVGIPAEALTQVFERFYRVDKARSRQLGGTGLGLAIVKHIVEGHGGRVWVEGNQPIGSRFVVWLPAAAPAREGSGLG